MSNPAAAAAVTLVSDSAQFLIGHVATRAFILTKDVRGVSRGELDASQNLA